MGRVSHGVNESILKRLKAGRVLTVFAADAGCVRRALVAQAEASVPSRTVVSVHWQRAPQLDLELDHIVRTMAEAARDLWPRWYATVDERFERDHWPTAELELRLNDARQKTDDISAAWFRKAWVACQKKALPIVKTLSSAEQLRQLALAIDPGGPIAMLAVSAVESPSTRIHSLARAAEWLAAQIDAPVVLVVPEQWSQYNELDVVNYEPIRWQNEDENASEVQVKPQEPPTLVLVEPYIGQPHPCSEVELLLYQHVTKDKELSPLFQFNRRATGYQGHSYWVDLLWQEGSVVVEIDGDDHRGPVKYQKDRDRDYHLLLAGYVVLRITNGDVTTDTTRVLEKIRNLVHLRQSQRGNGT